MEWYSLVLSNVLQLVCVVAAPVLSFLVWTLLKKWKINVELQTLDTLVAKGVAFAEEQANKALKAGEPLTSGAEKMKIAVDIAMELAAKYGLTKLAEDELKKLIEAKLGESREVVPPATNP